MKTSKRIFSIILSVIMILSLIPLTANAVEYSGTCGENLTWHLDDATGVLTISGTGDMKNYNWITTDPGWKEQRDDIEYIYIEEGVTSIGIYAFRGCSYLKHVEIPDSVTKICGGAFNECYALEKITLGTGLMALTSTSIPQIVPIFYNGTLEEWYKLEENNQYSFSEAGYGIHCTDADIYPKGVYSDNITWEFNDITGTLSFFGTGDMIGYEDCSDALDASYRGYTGKIVKVVFSEGITSIGDYDFYNFPSYKDFVIPSSVTSISSKAFLYYGLTYTAVIYYGGTVAQWKEIESTFDYHYDNNFIVHCIDGDIPIKGACGENLVWQLDIATGVLTISGSGAMDDYIDYDYDYGYAPWAPVNRAIKSVIIEEGVESVGEYAFYHYNNLTNVSVSEGVTTIGECALLGTENITLPESVTKIGMYNFVTSTTIHYAGTKKQWQALEKEHKNLFTSYHRVYCSDGELLPSGVCGENTTWVFDDATGTLTISGTGAIDDCVYIENGSRYFYQPWRAYQYDIKVINIEEGITSIGHSAFDTLYNLQSATLPSTLKIIGSQAFWACRSLKGIIIPYGVTTIGSSAFGGCMSLENVYYMGSEAQWNAIKNVANGFIDNTKVHYNSKITEYAVTCTSDGYVQYTCDCCGVRKTEVFEEATGHKYVASSLEVTCTEHGYTKHTCEDCGHSYIDYTANPTGHSLNEDGVCETCGEKEVSTSHINTQKLSIESILAMVMNFLSKLFGIFSVA